MNREVLFSKKFTKQFRKLSPQIQSRFAAQLALWDREPMNRRLNHHVLTGELAGFHSINVGGDLRALYREYGKDVVILDLRKAPPSPDQLISADSGLSFLDVAKATSPSVKPLSTRANLPWERAILRKPSVFERIGTHSQLYT